MQRKWWDQDWLVQKEHLVTMLSKLWIECANKLQKKSIVISLTDHAIQLAHGKNRPKNLNINKTISKASKKHIYQIYNNNQQHEILKYISIPYERGTTENIRKF